MTDFIATLVVFVEDYWRVFAFILAVMAIVWVVNTIRDPAKQMGLISQIFSTLWVVLRYVAIGLWEASKFLAIAITRVFTVTFATIRDFFISRN